MSLKQKEEKPSLLQDSATVNRIAPSLIIAFCSTPDYIRFLKKTFNTTIIQMNWTVTCTYYILLKIEKIVEHFLVLL